MKHKRSNLIIYAKGGRAFRAPSINLSEWHAHLPISEGRQGVSISHKSGLSAIEGLAPVQAAHALRELAALPPCPLADQVYRHAVRVGGTRSYPVLREWYGQVRGVVNAFEVEEVAP